MAEPMWFPWQEYSKISPEDASLVDKFQLARHVRFVFMEINPELFVGCGIST